MTDDTAGYKDLTCATPTPTATATSTPSANGTTYSSSSTVVSTSTASEKDETNTSQSSSLPSVSAETPPSRVCSGCDEGCPSCDVEGSSKALMQYFEDFRETRVEYLHQRQRRLQLRHLYSVRKRSKEMMMVQSSSFSPENDNGNQNKEEEESIEEDNFVNALIRQATLSLLQQQTCISRNNLIEKRARAPPIECGPPSLYKKFKYKKSELHDDLLYEVVRSSLSELPTPDVATSKRNNATKNINPTSPTSPETAEGTAPLRMTRSQSAEVTKDQLNQPFCSSTTAETKTSWNTQHDGDLEAANRYNTYPNSIHAHHRRHYDIHPPASMFIGKPIRLYCPNDNSYHVGRIVDYRKRKFRLLDRLKADESSWIKMASSANATNPCQKNETLSSSCVAGWLPRETKAEVSKNASLICEEESDKSDHVHFAVPNNAASNNSVSIAKHNEKHVANSTKRKKNRSNQQKTPKQVSSSSLKSNNKKKLIMNPSSLKKKGKQSKSKLNSTTRDFVTSTSTPARKKARKHPPTSSFEFLVRFRAGMDGRKVALHEWIALEEHALAVGMCLVWGYVGCNAFHTKKKPNKNLKNNIASSSEGSQKRQQDDDEECWRPGQIMLRTALEMVPVRELNLPHYSQSNTNVAVAKSDEVVALKTPCQESNKNSLADGMRNKSQNNSHSSTMPTTISSTSRIATSKISAVTTTNRQPDLNALCLFFGEQFHAVLNLPNKSVDFFSPTRDPSNKRTRKRSLAIPVAMLCTEHEEQRRLRKWHDLPSERNGLCCLPLSPSQQRPLNVVAATTKQTLMTKKCKLKREKF